MAEKELFYLNELSDYKVATNYPDVRGWEVKDADGRTVGKIDDLLVHKRAERVVYVDVEVDHDLVDVGHDPFDDQGGEEGVREYINKAGENHLIVPIGMVDIDEKNKLVRSDSIDHTTFRNTKRFSKGTALDRDYERTVYRSYVPDSDVNDINDQDETFYDRDEFRHRDRNEGDPPLEYDKR